MSKVKITPLGDRVLVKQVDEDEQIKGGIYIPDSAKEKPQEAEVVALGTGKKDDDGNAIPFQVKKGDKVLAGQKLASYTPLSSLSTSEKIFEVPKRMFSKLQASQSED